MRNKLMLSMALGLSFVCGHTNSLESGSNEDCVTEDYSPPNKQIPGFYGRTIEIPRLDFSKVEPNFVEYESFYCDFLSFRNLEKIQNSLAYFCELISNIFTCDAPQTTPDMPIDAIEGNEGL